MKISSKALNLVYAVVIFMILGLNVSLAADTSAVEQGDPTNLQAVTSSEQKVKVTALITIINKNNNRYLGGVKITIDQSATVTTVDPPLAEGHKLANLDSGQHEIVAERVGYKIFDEKINIPSDKQFYELKIAMEPTINTPVVDSSYFTKKYGTNTLGYPNNYSQYGNSTVTNPWNSYQSPQYNSYGYNGQTNQYYNSNYNYNGPVAQDSISQSRTISINTPSNLAVTRNSQNGDYIIYNRSNTKEFRHMYFIDRGDGQGGTVFFSASVEIDLSQWQMGYRPDGWFVSTYTKDQYGNAAFTTGQFDRTTTSPETNSQNLYGQLTGNTQNPNSGLSTSSPANNSSCIVRNNINFCFTDDNTRSLALSGSMNVQLDSISQRINENAAAMRDKMGKPDFIVLANQNDSFWEKVGEGTKAFTCLIVASSSTTGGPLETCTDVVKRSFPQEQLSQLSSKGYQLKFMVINSQTNISQREDRVIVDHEWSHIYDYQSNNKGTVADIYQGMGTQPTVSVNKNFGFADFFATTNVAAQASYEKLINAGKFNITKTLTDYPLCVYGAMNDYISYDPSQITDQEVKIIGKLPVNRAQEVFAYTYSLVRDQKISSFNNLYDRFGSSPGCKTSLTALQSQYGSLFSTMAI